MDFSVLITIKGRREHLANVLRGIQAAALRPSEIIVVHMNEPQYELGGSVTQIELHDDHPLPLALARNTAARAATTDRLIFLDVDCIPAPDCFDVLLADLQHAELVMAEPRYLQTTVVDISPQALLAQSAPHKLRVDLGHGLSDSYEMFWSLGFAIKKADFDMIGGFDEAFTGYGGEDTDFAFSARQFKRRLYMSRALVFHQNHPSYDPPLNWLEDIVQNAIAFKRKWQVWPMEGWLSKFEALGFVDFTPDELKIVTLPSQADIAAALKATA